MESRLCATDSGIFLFVISFPFAIPGSCCWLEVDGEKTQIVRNYVRTTLLRGSLVGKENLYVRKLTMCSIWIVSGDTFLPGDRINKQKRLCIQTLLVMCCFLAMKVDVAIYGDLFMCTEALEMQQIFAARRFELCYHPDVTIWIFFIC